MNDYFRHMHIPPDLGMPSCPHLREWNIQAALKFFLDEPARKEILTGFGPLYLDPNQTKTQRVLLVIRTVRNNIFHGGKIQPEGEKEKGRNEKLVGSSLTVLEHAAGLHGEVSKKFHEAKA